MNSAIEVRNVTKIYRLYDKNTDRLKESLGLTKKNLHKDFYALKDVSFDVEKGQSVGIIGTNGSGKSTMLKIITGVLTPTMGQVKADGKISALLELGAGFNMEYTGIENIYMNGTMMGFTKAEMDAKLDEILKFADIGDFVYQPVKAYSSGMFVRLAFALAINVDPEILIVDEALSVGDIFFQSKCYHHMDELRKKGTTILMVTHDMSSVLKYCDKAVLLNDGVKVEEGKPGEIIDLYKKILAGQYDQLEEMLDERRAEVNLLGTSEEAAESKAEAESRADTYRTSQHSGSDLMRSQMTVNPNVNEYGDNRAEIYDFGIYDKDGRLTNLILKGEEFTIREKIHFNAHIEAPIFTYTFRDKKGNDLSGSNTMFENAATESVEAGDEYDVKFTQKMDLQGGEYLLSMSCTGFEQGEHVVYHRLYDLLNLTVISNKNTVGVYDMNSKVELRKN
ncbi:MAG: ABC transporter ATP-binding protein [Eubacteriales bacterium]|nr:ABC transporter ATP-binding protein [Eubacteriales bacterium]